MVKLYGVVFGAELKVLDISLAHTDLGASEDLFSQIFKLPKGSNIGLGWLDNEQWMELSSHAEELCDKAGLEHISYSGSQLWDEISGFAKENGHKITFLEDSETWRRYNKALVDRLKFRNKHYDKFSLIARNETDHELQLRTKRLYELERDERMLENIAASDVDIVIVGTGHSDPWYTNRESIKEDGIDFESYSTQIPSAAHPCGEFVENAEPEDRLVFDPQLLRRMINLSQGGRLTEEVPDYVGTWDLVTPSHGYFEIFVQDIKGDTIYGTIKDLLGDAQFVGKVDDESFDFSKKYIRSGSESVMESSIVYEAKRLGDEFIGTVFGMMPFYLVKADKMRPIQMYKRFSELSSM